MTAVYDKLGLKFLYPENWKLTDENDTDFENRHCISLETPDGSTSWEVHLYPGGTDRDEIMKETLASLNQTYEDLEVSVAPETEFEEFQVKGVETLFYCLDFLIKAELFTVELPNHMLLFWYQAEDREFDKNKLVFQAISISLLRSLVESSSSG